MSRRLPSAAAAAAGPWRLAPRGAWRGAALAPPDWAAGARVRRLAAATSEFEYNEAETPFGRKRGPPVFRTAQGAPLPDGWREHRSPSRGTYYAHERTGVVQWDIPRGPPTRQQVDDARRAKYGETMSQLHPGAEVRLVDLQTAPQLNGKTGTCDRWDHASGMVRVRLASGELKAVKPENLMLVQASARRLRPERLLAGGTEEPRVHGADQWLSPGAILLAGTGGLAAYWALRYRRYEADRQAREAEAARVALEAETAAAASSGAPAGAPAGGPAGGPASGGAGARPPEALPAGWREGVDPMSGRPYYWQDADPARSTTWARPVRPAVGAAAAAGGPAPEGPGASPALASAAPAQAAAAQAPAVAAAAPGPAAPAVAAAGQPPEAEARAADGAQAPAARAAGSADGAGGADGAPAAALPAAAAGGPPAALGAPAGAPLPAGWREAVDPATGRSYFWQEADPARTTSWARPGA